MPHPFDIAIKHARAYRDAVKTRPPRPTASADALESALGGPTPEHGQDAGAVIEALARGADPGLMGITGSRFFGWVIGGSHEAGVAADWLTSAWGQNAGLYAGSPAAAVLEGTAARWLVDILRLPSECSVGFVTGATMANFVGLAAARNEVLRRAGWDVEAEGLQGAPRVRVIMGDDAHTTVFASLRFLGFGQNTPIRIATDSQGRMDAEAFEAALATGDAPTIVIAQAGQINTGAFDPIGRIAKACRARGAWLHVDGAFGLWARAVPELAHLADGIEDADSWATDGHKWLQAPYDSGFVFVRDPAAHQRAMTIAASYLPQSSAEYEASHYTPELSRRARGVAVWALLRTMGREGVTEMVRRHCGLAARVARQLAAEASVRVHNEVCLNQIIVSFGEGDGEARDAATRAVIERLQDDNVCFAGGASWRGRWVMRISVISGPLQEVDVDRLGDAILSAWRAVRAEDI